MSPVDQAMINLVTGVAVWRESGFEVDSFVHEVLALGYKVFVKVFYDRLLPHANAVV
jgi:hypothetical protein